MYHESVLMQTGRASCSGNVINNLQIWCNYWKDRECCFSQNPESSSFLFNPLTFNLTRDDKSFTLSISVINCSCSSQKY